MRCAIPAEIAPPTSGFKPAQTQSTDANFTTITNPLPIVKLASYKPQKTRFSEKLALNGFLCYAAKAASGMACGSLWRFETLLLNTGQTLIMYGGKGRGACWRGESNP